LFTIRDFDDTRENIDFIKETVNGHLKKLWEEINKPAKFLNTVPDDFFTIDYFPLAHYNYCREKFNNNAKSLALRFTDADNDDYYFNHVDKTKNLPFDGLPVYIEKVWNAIKENKELNLPGQKTMVSNYRCGEEKINVIQSCRIDIEKLKSTVSVGISHDLSKDMRNLMNRSISMYQSETVGYAIEVVEEKQKEMEKEMIEEFGGIEKVQIQ